MDKEKLPSSGPEKERDFLPHTLFLDDPRALDVSSVGGKSASLARLSRIEGIDVPVATLVTTTAYTNFVEYGGINEAIKELDDLSDRWIYLGLASQQSPNSPDLIGEIEVVQKRIDSQGPLIRNLLQRAPFPEGLERSIEESYRQLCEEAGDLNLSVACRSSGIAEDRSDASFAGQYDTRLNQQGADQVLTAVKHCFASQFTDRGIIYRNEQRLRAIRQEMGDGVEELDLKLGEVLKNQSVFRHGNAKLAVAIQEMVDAAMAGTVFTVDSVSGARVTNVDANYGLGESVVGGAVTPDSYKVDPRTGQIIYRFLGEKKMQAVYADEGTDLAHVPIKLQKQFALSDEQIKQIAYKAQTIAEAYKREGMDIEFAIDKRGNIKMLQARPETVASQKEQGMIDMQRNIIIRDAFETAEKIFKAGQTGSPGVEVGKIVMAKTVEEALEKINPGDILVTERTDPDWLEAMKKAGSIMTEVGGPTCHAAIVAREMGIPCLVGAKGVMAKFSPLEGESVTLDATNRTVYKGELPLKRVGEIINVSDLLADKTNTQIGLILSNPDTARKMHALGELGDNFGIGLLRIEFLLNEIGVHVRALEDYDGGKLAEHPSLVSEIEENIAGYPSAKEYFISKLSEGIATFAAVFPDSPITIRTTDFKTNEYEDLVGGELYEAMEANPMIGWRGLLRFLAPENREVVKWELEAIKRVKEMGYNNIKLMFPIVRDPFEITGIPRDIDRSELEEWLGEKGWVSEAIPEIIEMFTKEGFVGIREIMEQVGLEQDDTFKVGMMVEIPANVIRINDFIETGIDFISFGTNDLTMLYLAADRDGGNLQQIPLLTALNPSVFSAVRHVIKECQKAGVETSICGQAPSLYASFASMLVESGIGSINVMPDRYYPTYELSREAENKLKQLT